VSARLSRRSVLAGAAATATSLSLAAPARAAAWDKAVHGLSIFGDLALPPDFAQLAYADPAAPKGGILSLQASSIAYNQNFNTFNSLNFLILKGDGAQGLEYTFDPLMTRHLDETDAVYGVLVDRVLIEEPFRTYRLRLRPEARFHDGSPVTAEDVAWTLTTLKKEGHPLISQSLRLLESATAEEAGVVTIRLASGGARDLILQVVGLPVLSKAYYATRVFDQTTTEPVLGSGPYKVNRFEQGRFIEYERVRDHWAEKLPIRRGQYNFDRLRYEYFRDRTVALEGFKARAFLFREEFTSRQWATGYDFPALKEGRVKRETVPDESPSGTQGWWYNLRRPQFQNPRIREALGLCFDFEWVNENIMFSSFERTVSFFQGGPLAAKGLPSAEERALLDQPQFWGGTVPAALFGEPYVPPKSDKSGQDRALLRRAQTMLTEAGCRRGSDGALLLPGGQRFELEFLDFDPGLHPHLDSWIKNLGFMGIRATKRLVDATQYQRRLEDFEFDLVSARFAFPSTPLESLQRFYHSDSARTRGSRNYTGLAHPAVDWLLEKIAQAPNREEHAAACGALDRVLRHLHIWMPAWSKGEHWFAYWDVFGRPARKPKYDRGVVANWWYDEERAKRIGLGTGP
jgi:microcin C transport system substrate-binding protein